jgi:phosphatidylserine/phosphatidylglycerophosphate/cardiolipin synthase-like enzyme
MSPFRWHWLIGSRLEVSSTCQHPLTQEKVETNKNRGILSTAPNHSSVNNPQDAAWLSAIKHAKESIFIQTPNMNAEPLIDPLLDAIRRGVTVTAYVCLGYNDAGELLPFQNGTNEMVSNRLYNSLKTDEARSRLRIHNYVAKDQKQPIHNKFKRRSCHVKLMIVDGKVAIQGGLMSTGSFVKYLFPRALMIRSFRQR